MKIVVYVLVAVLFAMPTLQAAQAAPVRMVMVAEKDSKKPMHEDYSVATAAAYVKEHMKGYSEGRGLSVVPSGATHRRTRTLDPMSMNFLRQEFNAAHEVNEELGGKDPVDMEKMSRSLNSYKKLAAELRSVGLFGALGDLNVESVEGYLNGKEGPILVRVKDEGGKGVFHAVMQYKFNLKSPERVRSALEQKQKNILLLLIAHKASVKDRDDEGRTPLHYAAMYNVNPDVVSALLHGLDMEAVVQLVNEQDKQKNTPLHYAIMENNLKLVEFLLTFNASITIKNRSQETPLSLAKTASKAIATIIERRYKQLRSEGCCGCCLSCLYSCLCCS